MRRILALFLFAVPVAVVGVESMVAAAVAATETRGVIEKLSEKELQAFARAARAVFRIRQIYAPKVQAARSEIDARDFIVAAEKEMGEAIGREGLTVERYNEILKAAQRDPSLAARIQTLVDKDAALESDGDAVRQ